MGATLNAENDESFVRKTLKTLKSSALDLGGNLKFQKKTKPGAFYEWEHLRYQENGLTAGTLTSHPKQTLNSRFDKYSLFDNEKNFNRKAYQRNVQAITEFLTRIVFSFEKDHVFTQSNEIVNSD